MSTNPEDVVAPTQSWQSRRVVWFQGQHDSLLKAHKGETKEAARARAAESGEVYQTISLKDLFHFKPVNKEKSEGPAFLPSTYDDFDAREHNAQRVHGSFVALTADIDKGDHDLEAIKRAAASFAPKTACFVYSSANARPGDKRWRIIMPLADPQPFEAWHDAQLAFFAYLQSQGIECDYALARAAQPVYLPNVPERHDKSDTALRGEDGKPLYYKAIRTPDTWAGLDLGAGFVATGIAAIRHQRLQDEQARELIRREAEQRRASAPRGEGASIMEDFNAENSVATMLEICGYEQCPRNADDWRSPHQTGETYATRVIGSKWVSLSASDVAARLGSQCAAGCYGDAYDLYVHYKHGGDHKAAFRAIHAEKRAAQGNVVYPKQFDPPAWMDEAPMPDEPPEWFESITTFDTDYSDLDLETGQERITPSLPFFWFGEAQANLEANDFVEGIFTTGSMSVVYGPSNCGKTFFIVDMALHVAWGREWRGHEVDRGAIVYLSLEGAQGIRNRLAAFRTHHGLENDNLPFVAMPQPVNLLNNDADVNAVVALVAHVAEATGLPVSMVIIDTLSRAMAGGNENSPEDMTALIGNCDRIRNETGSHVCIVHHSGKDEAKGARGHSSLRAATDTEIEIKRDPELTFSSVRIAKQRDLEAGDPFAFSLHKVGLGINRRNKEVASCVVVEAENTVVVARSQTRLSAKEVDAVNCLNKCIIAGGFEIEINANGDVARAVTLHAWKRSLEASNVIDRNNDHVARTQFARLKKTLENKAQITIEGDKVWFAQHDAT